MATAALEETRLALSGALQLARGDPRGLTCFDPGEDGFWRSFRAAVLGYPFYLIILAFPVEIGPAPDLDLWTVLVVETIHYVIAWVAFPLLMLPLVDWLRRGDRYFGFMVVYNWCQLPQMAVFAAVALVGATGVLSPDGVLTADLIVGIATLVYEWYVSRVALAISRPKAVLVIVVDVVLAAVLSHISTSLY
jgi:hypothetical protein